jgi:hypothetical protein
MLVPGNIHLGIASATIPQPMTFVNDLVIPTGESPLGSPPDIWLSWIANNFMLEDSPLEDCKVFLPLWMLRTSGSGESTRGNSPIFEIY